MSKVYDKNNYKSLYKNKLKYGDLIKICNKTYEVQNTHFHNLNPYETNDIIFELLNIKYKYSFASNIYNYEIRHGDFPPYKINDYKSATKIAIKLFKLAYELEDVWLD